MLARTHTAQIVGLHADIVDAEVDVSRGLNAFSLVGLPDKAVEEAKDRILAALKNSKFESPQRGSKKVVVSLAPADVRKEGTGFDVAIAIGLLIASGSFEADTEKRLFFGELSLNGDIRGVKGILLLAQKAKKEGFSELYVPVENAREAALVHGVRVYPTRSLRELADHLIGERPIAPQAETEFHADPAPHQIDFSDIRGQETAKRGLEIAAAGGHNIAMSGPPGSGKTMLAKAFVGILPPLSFEEALEVTGIHSAAGALDGDLIVHPPFRAPHHTASYVSLVGGGTWPKPGEITLAHRGALFLDEFPEFERRVIESLRQPLEEKVVAISRAKGTIRFPAQVMLIAAMNLCPCGNTGQREKLCQCSPGALAFYRRKISGPIVDRIDLWLDVPQIEHRKLSDDSLAGESSASIRERVLAARERAHRRLAGTGLRVNSEMGVREIKKYAPLPPALSELLNRAAARLDLSARAYHRVIKLARTIADLEGARDIGEAHLTEALTYRPRVTM